MQSVWYIWLYFYFTIFCQDHQIEYTPFIYATSISFVVYRSYSKMSIYNNQLASYHQQHFLSKLPNIGLTDNSTQLAACAVQFCAVIFQLASYSCLVTFIILTQLLGCILLVSKHDSYELYDFVVFLQITELLRLSCCEQTL